VRSRSETFARIAWLVDRFDAFWPDFPGHVDRTDFSGWTLLNETGEIILDGTWSAQKMGQGWQGTWTARARKGAPLSGTWNADLATFSGKTIQAMLERTAEKEVAGSWRTRGYQGNWWLKGSPRR
jgi:hypothetical protein